MLANPINGPVPEPVQKVRLERRVASGVGSGQRPRISSSLRARVSSMLWRLDALSMPPGPASCVVTVQVVTITPEYHAHDHACAPS